MMEVVLEEKVWQVVGCGGPTLSLMAGFNQTDGHE